MTYAMVPVVIVLAVLLLVGLVLVLDALRRVINEGRESKHDLRG